MFKVDWTVVGDVKKYYIFYRCNGRGGGRYLHKDMTVHDICGSGNFWCSKEEAYEAISAYSLINGFVEFISEKDMMLE